MNSKKILKYIVLIVLLQFQFNVYSFVDTTEVRYDSSIVVPLKFDENNLEKYRSDKDFDYTEYKYENTYLNKFKNWIKNILLKFFEWIFGQKKAGKTLEKFFQIIPYVALGIVLFFFLKFFLNINFKDILNGNTTSTTVTYGEEEEIIRNKDIDKLIKEAKNKRDFRLAIRYYYLKFLKVLEEKNYIEREHQKTNYEYYNEIKNKDIKNSFQQFTLWYEYIWYGKFVITDIEFERLSKEFDIFFNNKRGKR